MEILLCCMWLRTQRVGAGGSRCPINSQSSVTFRNKHYYNIHDSFSQAAMCGKIRWMLSGEKTWGWLWLRKQWWIVTSWWNASIKRWFWRSAPNTHISDCRWIMFFIFVFFVFLVWVQPWSVRELNWSGVFLHAAFFLQTHKSDLRTNTLDQIGQRSVESQTN